MKRVSLLLAVIFLMATRFANPEERMITGKVTDADSGSELPGVNVVVKGTKNGTVTDINGEYEIKVSSSNDVLVFSFIGYVTEEIRIGNKNKINVKLNADIQRLEETVVVGYSEKKRKNMSMATPSADYEMSGRAAGIRIRGTNSIAHDQHVIQHNTEDYATIHENQFLEATKNPLSTFSIDVDAASYSNIRRFINNGSRPPKDAVRIEEMINYFTYDYPQPTGEDPFNVITEMAECPWNNDHKLVHIGLQGKKIATDNLPPSNLVFLIDVSGSMSASNKLPLLKSSFKMLVDELRPQDRVAIVVYAGAAGTVLPSTPGNQKETIIDALDRLQAGGSTAGGAGIKLAYKIAEEHFAEEGNNRVILATDGDFNIGASSDAAMERLIEEKRGSGVFLTVLGYGMGNYKDNKMEILADKGNGNYAYIDNILEAKKVLVNEFGGTLFTIAKDVKLQIEFNPTKVQAYRLVGYENRLLADEDFNDDKKDAGELGSGHTVTALYEIIPVGVKSEFVKSIDELKYQENKVSASAYKSKELMNVKLRYKKPDGNKSKLIEQPVADDDNNFEDTSDNFRFSASVASFGMILRESEFKGTANLDMVMALAKGAKGADEEGYRSEFIRLVESSRYLASK